MSLARGPVAHGLLPRPGSTATGVLQAVAMPLLLPTLSPPQQQSLNPPLLHGFLRLPPLPHLHQPKPLPPLGPRAKTRIPFTRAMVTTSPPWTNGSLLSMPCGQPICPSSRKAALASASRPTATTTTITSRLQSSPPPTAPSSTPVSSSQP